MEKRFFRFVLLAFAALVVFGVAGIISQGSRIQDEGGDVDPVYLHGYQVGYTLAKSGMVKPTAEQLDANARQAALALKDPGGLGFKMQWKSGFDHGWRAGD